MNFGTLHRNQGHNAVVLVGVEGKRALEELLYFETKRGCYLSYVERAETA